MGLSMNPMSFMTFAKRLALKGRLQHHILLSRMVWRKGRIVRLWKLSVLCFTIKDFRSFYEPKLRIPPYMCKTDAFIEHWVPRLPKRCSLVRNLTYLILESLEALYIFMCRKRKGINWVHQEIKEASWVIVKILRAIESM